DSPAAVAATPTRLLRDRENRDVAEGVLAGLAKAASAMEASETEGCVAALPEAGVGSPFGELTDAEVSDIMQALSAEVDEGNSRLLSSSSSSLLHHPPIAAATPPAAVVLGDLPRSPSSLHHCQQEV
ncbi:unnamed protein product, partial [Pylaiella littoralis]